MARHDRSARDGIRHADPRIRHEHREHAPAVVGKGDARVRLQRVQRRRLRAGGPDKERNRDDLEGALSERQQVLGQGASPEAGVLLCRGLAAGHHPPVQALARVVRRVRRQDRDPAQRHTPCDRSRRTDASAGRRRGRGVGPGVGHHRRVFRLHEPHRDARSARAVVGRTARQGPAAPPADHLRDQPSIHEARARQLPRRRCPLFADVDRGRRRAPRRALDPHGPSRDRRQPFGERRVVAAQRHPEEGPVPRLCRDVPRAFQQQDEWHHSAAVVAALQPGAVGPDHGAHRRRMGRRSQPAREARCTHGR